MATTRLTRRRFLHASAGALGGAALASGGITTSRRTAAAQEFAGKTVSIATVDGELSNGITAQMEAFEQATGAKIELNKIPGAELNTKITADLSSGTGAFDVIIEPFIFLHGHAAGGFYEPLDERAGADPDVALDDFIPMLLETMGKYDGKLYGLPYKADAYVFFYRKDLFADPAVQAAFTEQTGTDLKAPDTVDELIATARFFTKSLNPDSPTEFGWAHMAESGASANWIWASRLAVYGGSYLDADFRPNFNNDAGRAAMAAALQLNETCPPDIGSYGWEESNTSFLTGKVAMMEQWPGLSKMAETEEGFWGRSEVIGKTGYAVPAGADVNGTIVKSSVLGGWAAAVSTHAEDKDLAYRAVSFLTSKEGEPLKIAAGNDPCRRSTYENPEISGANPLYPTLMQCLEQARITADVDAPPVGFELQTVMGQAFNQVWIGDAEGDAALADVEEQWVEILERARLAG
ncbi:MAG: ABC transporter substrate-binding protein [Thermomicrobiales bacterium]